MKWTKARLTGLSVVDLPIVGASPSDKFILKELDFGDVVVAVSKSDLPAGGSVYQGRRPNDMEIDFTIKLNPDYTVGETVSDLRTRMYGMLTPGSGDIVKLEIMNGSTAVAQTTGWVSKLENNKFSKDPELILTIVTSSPYLVAPAPVGLALPTSGAFNFTLTNPGSAPSGFTADLHFTTGYTPFVLTSSATGKRIRINYSFANGEHLQFSTVEGNRYIRAVKGAVTTNLLPNLYDDTDWIQLYGGDNTFSMTPPASISWDSITVQPKYWGV